MDYVNKYGEKWKFISSKMTSNNIIIKNIQRNKSEKGISIT
jgi:hypothetical protein